MTTKTGKFRILVAIFAVMMIFMGLPVLSYEYSDSVDWKKFDGQNISINVYNWGEYISVDDGEEGAFDTNAEFERLTGIKVNYTNFSTNEEMYAKLKGGGASYDIVIPSDYMIARMISENMLEPLNFANIPNFSYIMDKFKNNAFDPQNLYSVPYMWGLMGIIYNKTMVDETDDVNTWNILWNEKYAKNILMFSNPRDTFAIAMFKLGYDVNSASEEEWKAAQAELAAQKKLVQAYVMDEIFDKMGGGEAALAPYYAGDAITMMNDNPDLAFAVPVEGTNVFIDAVCIPKGAKNKEAAELYINFLCETTTALKNCEYIGYSTPHSEAYNLLDEETKSGISYPSDEVLAKAQAYTALPPAAAALLDQLWTDLISDTGSNVFMEVILPWLSVILIGGFIMLIIYINIRRSRKKKSQEY